MDPDPPPPLHRPAETAVEAIDDAAVDALVRNDPFWPTGLRKSVRILAWAQVFADGERLIAV
jgi:uncharacterized protein YciI